MLKAQERLERITDTGYPYSKKEDQRKLMRDLKKAAMPFREQKTAEEAADIIKGLIGG